jgi:hypothetical protein
MLWDMLYKTLPILLFINVYALITLVLQESKVLFAQPFNMYSTLASTFY